jgi:signal transduction histidine kinase
MTEPLVDIHMLSNFVHQIINPLNGVLGTLDNVIDGTIPRERTEQRLASVRAQLEHAVELIRNLAYLSQLSVTSGNEELRQQRIQCLLPEIIISALQFYQEHGFTRGIKIRLTDSEGERLTDTEAQFMVPGHVALLRQVFMNIFENCVKYGDENSSINVTPREQRSTGDLLVEITGTGIGFAPDEAERIFELGYRGTNARKTVVAGSGIGLFICKKILTEVHEASIKAEHNPANRRTVFRIRFPKYVAKGVHAGAK